MTQSINQHLFGRLVEQSREIYAAGCGGHSLLFEQWLCQSPNIARDTRFTGVYIPGVNCFDFAALSQSSRMQVFFLSSDFRRSYDAEKIDYLPLSYTQTYRYLASACDFDLSLIQVSPPDEQGNCSLGIACDFTPAALPGSTAIVAHINPNMPRTQGPTLNLKDIDYCIESQTPLLQYPDSEPNETLVRVASNVASLIGDGATLQFGLGKLQAELFRQLAQHQNLSIYSGMISDSVLTLLDNGNLNASGKRSAITTGVALGSNRLYQRVHNNQDITFASVDRTHDIREIAKLDNFVSINSALEIDLMCQVNVDTINGKQISGAGGLTDFIRGSQYSRNGKSIIAFPSTYGKKMSSRIISQITKDNLCSVSRNDVDYVVTENGIADLKHLSVTQKADALIDIAASQHRDQLKLLRDSQ